MQTTEKSVMIESWLNAYGDELFSWALVKTSSKEDAEDLVQETFLAVYKSYHNFDGRSSIKTYLFSILNNKIADHYRKKYRMPASNGSLTEDKAEQVTHSFFDNTGRWAQTNTPWSNNETHLLDNPEFLRVMELCMDDLPHEWGSILQEKYFNNKKGRVICQDYGISQTNYWQILHRAKLLLKACVENLWKT